MHGIRGYELVLGFLLGVAVTSVFFIRAGPGNLHRAISGVSA
jgi:hypothetical protein